ncbi:MAG TPA: hypothetical protein VGQ25_09065 [Gemmatimonadales bacterium]|jgi:hypothetical protein|nr:hypothetical protein [Gemmatimonadales bacterium]
MARAPTLRLRTPHSALRTALALCFSAPLAAQTPGAGPPKVTGYIQTRFEAIGDSALFKLRRPSAALELPERAISVDSLAPNRDVGVKVEWGATQPVALQGGVFNGDGSNRAGNRDGRF